MLSMRKKNLLFIFLCSLLTVGLTNCTFNNGGKVNPTPSDPSDPSDPSEPGGDEDEVKVSSITLGSEHVDLKIRDSFFPTITVSPENATNKKITWVSSSTSICSVQASGRIYAWKEGNVTITGTAQDGSGVACSYTVNVSRNAVSDITFSKNEIDLEVDEEETITYTIVPSNATYKNVALDVEDELVAEATLKDSNKITIKALSVGTTNLVVTSEDPSQLSRTVAIEVHPVELKSISFSKDKYYLNENDSLELGITFSPSNATYKEYEIDIADETKVKVEGNTLIGLAKGKTNITVTSTHYPLLSNTASVEVFEEGSVIKTVMAYSYKDIANNDIFNMDSCPSLGHPKLLVIPVWFSDSNTFIDVNNKNVIRDDIAKAYFGSNEDTGWRSVSSYYEEDSFGNVILEGEVSSWYECGMSYSSFCSENGGYYQTRSLVNSAVSWYKTSHDGDDFTVFDTDGNGYLDGVMLIYAAPDYRAFGKTSQESEYSNLWAYCSRITSNSRNVNNPTANVFFWASYDFMYNSETSLVKTGKTSYGGGDNSYDMVIDAHTYIHEMGHIFGLDDYYDYGESYAYAGNFSMQDYNVGGHDPYSRIALGWINPYVVTDSAVITINTTETSGDVILVTNSSSSSPFDEYILVELFSPEGLNERDTTHPYRGNYPSGTTSVGVKLWHVDARLIASTGSSTYSINQGHLTTNPFESGYKVHTVMNNTSDGSRDICNKSLYQLLYLIRNDKGITCSNNRNFSGDDLFYQGDSFDMFDYGNQFANKSASSSTKGALNSTQEFNFSISVTSLTSSNATISIVRSQFKKYLFLKND